MAREISLSCGAVTLVDDDVADRFGGETWRITKPGWKWCYVGRSVRQNGRNTVILLHRVIVGAGAGQYVDHINHDTLDNRRANLRICTNAQNAFNSVRAPGAIEFRGVSLRARHAHRPYRATIRAEGRKVELGYYATPEEAARAYDVAARIHHGEFAVLNFPGWL